MNVRFVTGTLYDESGKDITVPDEHCICIGKGGIETSFVKTKNKPIAEFIWRDPTKGKTNG